MLGGAPTYVLTDNEKTVTAEHVAGSAGAQPADGGVRPALRGHDSHLRAGSTRPPRAASESTVKIAKADLVPKDTNLLPAYASFAELEAACEAFMTRSTPGCTGSPAGFRRRCSPRNGPGCTRCRRSRTRSRSG